MSKRLVGCLRVCMKKFYVCVCDIPNLHCTTKLHKSARTMQVEMFDLCRQAQYCTGNVWHKVLDKHFPLIMTNIVVLLFSPFMWITFLQILCISEIFCLHITVDEILHQSVLMNWLCNETTLKFFETNILVYIRRYKSSLLLLEWYLCVVVFFLQSNSINLNNWNRLNC